MIMYNGESVYPAGKGVPTVNSLGVGLGRIARFAGQTKLWYPVLAHVVVVAAIMDRELAVHGLLHDAPEVCCSDVPTPWKTVAAKKREKVLLRRIYKAHDLAWPIDPTVQQAVDAADAMALAAEAHVIGHAEAKRFWPTYDEHTAEMTRYMLKDCREMLDAEFAGPYFTGIFGVRCAEHKNAESTVA